jgi:hypothetical protein
MEKALKLLFKILLVFTLVLGVLILALEISSRRLNPTQEPPRPPEFLACDTNRYPPDQEKIDFLAVLVEKQLQGLPITQEDLDRSMYLVPNHDMVGINGLFCNGMIYISDRLKQGARYYVARHELEHVFQAQGLSGDCGDQESCAHWTAAKEYPLGLIQTVVSSIVGAYRLSPSLWAFLVNNWVMFKFYFLGLR